MSPQARKAAIASGRAVEVAADDFAGLMARLIALKQTAPERLSGAV